MLKLQPFPILCDKTLTFCLLRITIHYSNLSKHWKSIWWMNTPDQMIDRSMLCFFEQERLSCQIVSIVPRVGIVWSLVMTPQPEIARLAITAPARLKSPTQQVISTYSTGRKRYLQIDLFMHIPFYLPIHIHHNNKVFSYQVIAYTVWNLKDIQFS